MIPIKYIGQRATYREGAYGSGIVFVKDETINVEDDELARKLLKHPDVYVRGDSEKAVETTTSKAKDAGKEDADPLQDARDAIATMTKEGLETFAKTHFNVDLDKRKSIDSLRTQTVGLIDQYGLE